MKITNSERAEVLTHAFPYIKKYYGKTVVVKYGGNAMVDDILKEDVMSDIALLALVGIKVVLVHGGGPEISSMLKKIGKTTSFVDGLRVTDKETVDVATMVLAGKINKELVNEIQLKGGRAIGLSGIDDHMLKVEQIDKKYGYVGEVKNVNIKPINDIMSSGYIPVIATIGYDDKGEIYNVNADTAAAAISGALKAESFIVMTDTSGIMTDINDMKTLIPKVNVSETPKLMHDGVITGGMIPKVECCTEAIRRGVNKVFIIDGRIPHSLIIELMTDEGIGTMFVGKND